MAASIKMDELMVSWLVSDSMYENVLSLIEEHKLAAQKQQQIQQQQQQQQLIQDGPFQDESGDQTADDASSSVKDGASKDGTTTTTTTFAEDASSYASPRCVIPKFYLGDPSRPRRRRRLLPMPQSDTWEPLPENEQETAENSRVFNNSNNLNSSSLAGGDETMTAAPDVTTVPSSMQAPMLCVRDQVQAVYEEIGQGEGNLSQKFITVQDFIRVTKDIFRFPTFFNVPLCQRLFFLWRSDKNLETTYEEPGLEEPITYEMVQWYWLQEMEPYDMQERFFRLCKQPTAEYIVRDDFLPFIKALLNDHPGLEFLSNHAEFQEKYAVTVITRIFYCVNKCHSGRITCRQIRRSDLLDAFTQVDEEQDINKVTRYFSYEHFYVLYCRFWELDNDRDYRITREDLLKYGDHSLSHMIVDRIFDAAPRPFEQPSALDTPNEEEGGQNAASANREYLSYEDFIYFMLSEEDKANDVSVRYWFSCVDVDGDGRLNNMEMRSFYAVQLHRMQCLGHEIVPFEDMLCQMMDMIKPACTEYLVVEDFLQTECAPVAGAFFDALFNLNKYLLFEQRDPFVERQKREDEFETDWDRFACIDYNRLAMEEEAREEEAMEIDWVTVDDEEEDGLVGSNAAAGGGHGMQMQVQQQDDYMGGAGGYGGGVASSEAPF